MTTLYYRAVIKHRVVWAMVWTGAIDIFDFAILATLLVGWQAERVPCLLAYVIGAMFGTGIVLRHSKKRDDNDQTIPYKR